MKSAVKNYGSRVDSRDYLHRESEYSLGKTITLRGIQQLCGPRLPRTTQGKFSLLCSQCRCESINI